MRYVFEIRVFEFRFLKINDFISSSGQKCYLLCSFKIFFSSEFYRF